MITVFDITRVTPNGKSENVFTSIKQGADKFVLDSMFMDEVEFHFYKQKMPEKHFKIELSKRKKLADKKQIGSI